MLSREEAELEKKRRELKKLQDEIEKEKLKYLSMSMELEEKLNRTKKELMIKEKTLIDIEKELEKKGNIEKEILELLRDMFIILMKKNPKIVKETLKGMDITKEQLIKLKNYLAHQNKYR